MASDFTDFVLAQLPRPCRLLEVGCGAGELAHTLDAAGHDVLAIDPAAPEGAIFQRVTLEELELQGDVGVHLHHFDAVVASRSLHHMHDLGAALDKLALLAPLLILDEFAWDRLDARTADWYESERRVLLATGAEPEELDPDGWVREHEDLHGFEAMRTALDERFEARHFEWAPYLYRYLDGVATESLERTLIEMDAIAALGFRYAGVSSTTPSPARSR
ncbi:MAG: class I SAM-dependent methyltransferase [Actinomycetota bacterium]|nr:class I SAM-dependent methyltransferase [Actinomycetota bacterium]